jgi:hypothetical protein
MEVKMNWKKLSLLLIVVTLTFMVVSCNPDKNSSLGTATFTPLPETVQLIPALTPTSITAIATATPSTTPVATNTFPALPSSIGPTEEFSGKNSFGDGYIAHIPINDVRDMRPEEIVRVLITQWLEHYKTDNHQPDVMIKDYKIKEISHVDAETHENNPTLPITAGIKFSIIPPAQIPKEWRCLPESTTGPWCQLQLAFAVYGNENTSQYYWLKIINYGG